MTMPDLITLVRQAPAEDLPEIEVELHAAHSMAVARLRYVPASPVASPLPDDDGPDLTPRDIAVDLALYRRSGEPNLQAVYDLARAKDPLPTRRVSARRFTVPRKPYRAWKQRREGRTNG